MIALGVNERPPPGTLDTPRTSLSTVEQIDTREHCESSFCAVYPGKNVRIVLDISACLRARRRTAGRKRNAPARPA